MDFSHWSALCQRGLKTAFFSSVFDKLRQHDSFILSDFFRTQMEPCGGGGGGLARTSFEW